MRFYRVVISDPDNPATIIREYASLDSQGRFVPGALNIEFDIPVVGYGNPGSGAFVRIWGVSLADLGQSSDLNDKLISIYGGMSKGLPLANQNQQGLLAQGYIFQAYGNWMGTTQTLDLQIQAGPPPSQQSGNFPVNYTAGTPLAQAIETTLSIAYPGYSIDTSRISPDLVVPFEMPGQYTAMTPFANWLNNLSKAINPATASGLPYSGINIVFGKGKSINVIDNSKPDPTPPKEILFTDLIGQPQWQSPVSFQFNAILRGDLYIGQKIKMPVTQFTTIPTSLARFRQSSVFQGVAVIMGEDSAIRHVGNFRNPDGTSWITTVNCVVLP